MRSKHILAVPFQARHSTQLTTALGLMSVLLVAACAADTPAGLHSPGSSRSLVASSEITLGRASSFAALGASTVTCTGAGSNAGDVGVSPGSSITGFNPDCTLTGTLHAADDASASAQADAATAYGLLSATPCDVTFGTVQELGGLTLTAGTYCFPSSGQVSSGTLTLTGPGPFIFKVASTFITAAGTAVILTGGASCDSIYWLVGSSATLGGPVAGNILAYTSIGFDPGARLTGRAIALNAAVTMSGQNAVSVCQ
jgi:type VI secretion system secreted protein VgrG